MVRMTRKERERERVRQEILDAAEHEFSLSGFRDTSMSAIAARAELSVGTLYNFFPNKDALFITLLDTRASEFFHREEEGVLKIKCPLERIRFVLRSTFRELIDNLRLFRLFMDVKLEKNMPAIEKDHPLITVKIERRLRFLAGLFEDAIGAGLVRPLSTMLLAVYLDSMTFGLIERWDRGRSFEDFEKMIDELESLFLDGILVRRQ